MTTIFITGVSSGIGHGLASHYLDQGCQVYGLSRRTPDDLIGHESFRFESLDVREFDQIGPTLTRLLTGVDRLNLAILNAGVLGYFGDLYDAPMDDLKNTLDINLWSNKVLLDRLFACELPIAQVVGISSGASVNGHRGWSGYSISKAALNMMIKLYSSERPETHFTSLAPGVVDTAIQDGLLSREVDERYQAVEVLRAKRGTPDMPQPEEAASKLADCMARLPELVDSGDFADIRKLPGLD